MIFRKIMPFKLKFRILLFLRQFRSATYFKNTRITKKNKHAFVFLAADYGNLGDVAITYAQKEFIEAFSEFEVIEIPISKSLEGLHFVKRNIKKGDVVTLVGGGNLGDLYEQIEYIRQLIVKIFPLNRIISFPQTFDFSETEHGRKALYAAKKVYNAHPDIHFVAREQTSFGLMKKHFYNADVCLTPDIVLSLQKTTPLRLRNGIIICMRKDLEKKLSEPQTLFINSEIKKHFNKSTDYDTHINKSHLTIEEREFELNRIWDAFRSAELVITDRLHGMIFCHITNTPCLAFQNNNHKVRETYDWIKGNLNITLVTEYTEDKIIAFLKKHSFNTGEPVSLAEDYQPIISLLK